MIGRRFLFLRTFNDAFPAVIFHAHDGTTASKRVGLAQALDHHVLAFDAVVHNRLAAVLIDQEDRGQRFIALVGELKIREGAIVEDEVIIGAGSLVPPGKRLVSGYLYMGSPVKQVRLLSDQERAFFPYSAGNYVKLKDQHLAEGYDQPE